MNLRIISLLLLCFGLASAASAADYYGGMRIDLATAEKDSIRVQATGAEFVFDLPTGRIDLIQRIPQRRLVGTIAGFELKDAKLDGPNDGECRVTIPKTGMVFTISAASALTIRFDHPGDCIVRGVYQPAQVEVNSNQFFLPDETGGIALYPLGSFTCQAPVEWKAPWSIPFHFSGAGELWVSVFPPRPFDWAQSYEGILHSFSWKHPYPSDDQLEEWRKYGSTLALHSWIWQGTNGSAIGFEKDDSWARRDFIPKNEQELARVIRTAHRLNMKVIAYMSPFYQSDPTPAGIEEFVRQIDRACKVFGFDGAFFDGVYYDIPASYEVMRRVRKVIGNKGILYIHVTAVPAIRCPFVECYADYTLRGETVTLNRNYIRWGVSGWNISNTIGTTCYDATRPSKALIDLMLGAHARLPIWVDDGMWDGRPYSLSAPEMELMKNEYLPRLEQEKNSRPRSQ